MSMQDYDLKKISIVVIIVLVLVVILMMPKAPDEVKQPLVIEPTNQTTPIEKSVYEKKLDEVTADCMADESYINKEDCISSALLSVALSTLDTKYCDQIENQLLQDGCIQQVIYEQVKVNDDPSYCEKLGNASQDCITGYYISKAQFENDSSYCDKIGETDDGYRCHDAFYNDEAYETGNCSMLKSDRKKGLCIMNLAINQKDSKICEQIYDFETYGQCLGIFYANVTPILNEYGEKDYTYGNEL